MKKNKIKEENSLLISKLDMKTPGGKFAYAMILTLTLLATLLTVVPIAWAFLSGFKSVSEFNQLPPTMIPKEFHLENITELFTKYEIHKYILNSVIVIAGSLIVEVTFCLTSGYVLSKIRPVGGKVLFTLILWTMMMPGTLSMVPLFTTFIDFPIFHFSLMNTYFPMWIIAGANCFHIMLCKEFFDGIPKSYIEAARIDGASKLQIFYRIILPLSKPIIATLSTFVIIAQWNDFMWPLLMLKDKTKYTVGLALYLLKDGLTGPKALMFAMVVTIPLVIVYYIMQRFVTQNSVSEGEKG